VNEGGRDNDDDHEDAAKESFLNLAGEDGEIDAFELQNILNAVFKRGNCRCWVLSGYYLW